MSLSCLFFKEVSRVCFLDVSERVYSNLRWLVGYGAAADTELVVVCVNSGENCAFGRELHECSLGSKFTLMRACAYGSHVVNGANGALFHLNGAGREQTYGKRDVVDTSFRIRIGACRSVDESAFSYCLAVSDYAAEAVFAVGDDTRICCAAACLCCDIGKTGSVAFRSFTNHTTAGNIVSKLVAFDVCRENV